MRPLLLALVGALLLVPSAAVAGEAYGTLALVQERRAGFLEEVTRPSEQVIVERAGVRTPAERGMAIEEGDLLLTEAGSCVVTTPAGWRVTVGEHSQMEVHTTWTQRLGTAIYRVQASFGVRIERVEVLVEGTVFGVTWDGEIGEVAVTEGVVRVRGSGGHEAVVRAGERTTFTSAAPVEAEPLPADDRRALARQEQRLGSANGGFRSRADRLRIGLGGGVSAGQDRTWGTAQLRARVRFAGPAWASVSGGLMLRPLNPSDARVTLAFPLAFGVHGIADLPGGAVALLGGSFDLLLGERCVEPIACERVVSAEPGATVDVGVGMHLGKRLALSAQARFGAGLRREYGPTFQLSPDATLAPRIDLTVWLEVRL